jgi:hypothetical protein
MAKIGLISCVSMKQNREAEASELYISPLFKKSKEYATERLDKFFILSAKHGLLKPKDKIGPYDLTLNTMQKDERIAWAEKVYTDLIKVVSKNDEIVFLAGENYREFLETKIKARGNPTACPLFKMSIGEQLQWYSYFSEHKDRIADLDKFYSLIRRLDAGLSGGMKLKNATGNSGWPEKGVYFFFEDGEYRKTEPFESRVVRVGTHAVSEGSSSSLWNRLRTHRGGVDFSGNHRGSIFRLHVGKSLIAKEKLQHPTWGVGQNAAKEIKESEKKLEEKVSDVIGNMKILWLAISDRASADSDRSFIERNSIALLSCFVRKIDTSSKRWIGNLNPHNSISGSSLWNVNYVDEDYDPRFLEIFERFVNITIGKEPPVNESIVPPDWIINRRRKKKQLNLFE